MTSMTPKLAPDGEGALEKSLHLLRPGVGSHVEIVRLAAHQLIAHTAAGPQSLKASFAQPADHIDREFAFGHG